MKRYIRAAYGPDALEVLHNAVNSGNMGALDVIDALAKYMKPSDIQRAASELGLYSKLYLPKFEGYWSEDDKILWDSIDWEARDYKPYPVEDDNFMGEITLYRSGSKVPEKRTVEFIKYLDANTVFPPHYAPKDQKIKGFAGPMHNGTMRGKYMVHDRYDDWDLYERMSR